MLEFCGISKSFVLDWNFSRRWLWREMWRRVARKVSPIFEKRCCFLPPAFLVHSWTLKMEALCTSEMSEKVRHTTERHLPLCAFQIIQYRMSIKSRTISPNDKTIFKLTLKKTRTCISHWSRISSSYKFSALRSLEKSAAQLFIACCYFYDTSMTFCTYFLPLLILVRWSFQNQTTLGSKICGCHGGDYEEWYLQGCYAVWFL
jgi:hypothetical protein